MNDVTTIPSSAPRRADQARRRFRNRRLVVVAAAAAVAAAVALLVWLIAFRGDDTSSVSGPIAVEPVKPVAMSASGLATLASAIGEPIYWAGRQKGFFYELRRTEDGNTYIRYLPPGVDAGAGGDKYLTIATYPYPHALEAIEKVAGRRAIKVDGGGLALVDAAHPTSVHVAYPDIDYQVEVYDPSPAKALAIASSGRVRPAG